MCAVENVIQGKGYAVDLVKKRKAEEVAKQELAIQQRRESTADWHRRQGAKAAMKQLEKSQAAVEQMRTKSTPHIFLI